MKKPLVVISLFALLFGSFLSGAWYSRHGTGRNHDAERRVLHYIDPMNPANTSDKPGIAPCGMPMEPVYGDEESAGPGLSSTALSMPPGTVKITPQKQQIIGIQVGTVKMVSETHGVRTLGRIAPDENRIYRLMAATDGWMWDVPGSTTGSLVKKDQLMARINIYSNDFFTWQQQYLSELGKKGRLPQPDTQPSEARRATGLQPAGTPQSGTLQPDDGTTSAVSQPAVRQQLAEKQPLTKLSLAEYYANRAKLELLNLGVGETQLEELVQTGQYRTSVEVRAPVAGLVLGRSIFSHQKIDRGTECFRVADLSRVWIIADVFNIEAHYIRPGMSAKISLPGQNRRYEARVSDVPPLFDATTRTLKVRLEMDNPKNTLRPEMIVDVEFQIPLPSAMTVPASAVLNSGRRQTVFAALGNGFFEPRTVVTGWRFGDRIEIVEGLQPGEQIVISGNFLIDSESRMRPAEPKHD